MVNEVIFNNLTVRKSIETLERAKKKGAMALFGEKYGEKVRMISIGGYSKELCGGTHVYATGDIGYFKIVSEAAVQAGVRRIEGVTREKAVEYSQSHQDLLEKIKEELKISDEQALLKRIAGLKEELKKAKKQGKKQQQQDQCQLRDDILEKAPEVGGAKLIVRSIKDINPNDLRGLSDFLRKAKKPAVGLLAAPMKDKAFVVCFVGDKLLENKKLHAGEMMGILSSMLKGGGDKRRQEFSQGQVRDISRLDEALETVRKKIEEGLK